MHPNLSAIPVRLRGRMSHTEVSVAEEMRRQLSHPLSVLLLVAGIVLALGAPASAVLPPESEWRHDVRQAMSGSRTYVEARVDGSANLAVNLDIDNTSLATRYHGGRRVYVVRRFADFAEDRGVAVLFNTGRLRGDGRMVRVAARLRTAGFTVTAICGRASDDEGLSHSKRRCRARFVRQGYTIIANVGNRSTDFTGGNYERAFRLPSYGNQLD